MDLTTSDARLGTAAMLAVVAGISPTYGIARVSEPDKCEAVAKFVNAPPTHSEGFAREKTFLLTGNGDVIEPEDGIVAIGSGGPYAQAAARALIMKTTLDAPEIAATAMQVAAGMCIYTNDRITVEEL